MSDLYTEDEPSSRRKFLAPLIVLMLCAVALTGAGYAYSAGVYGNGSGTEDVENVTLYIGDEDNTFTIDTGKIYFDSTNSADALTTYTYTANTDKTVCSFKVGINQTSSKYTESDVSGKTPAITIDSATLTGIEGVTISASNVTATVGTYDSTNHCWNVDLKLTGSLTTTTAPTSAGTLTLTLHANLANIAESA